VLLDRNIPEVNNNNNNSNHNNRRREEEEEEDSHSLDVRRTHLSTVGDRAFPVAAIVVFRTVFHRTSLLPPLSPSAVVLNFISSHFSYLAF